MKLYIQQKVFSRRHRFIVKDGYDQDKYYVESEKLTWGKKLHVYDMNQQEIACIEQKGFGREEFRVFQSEQETAVIRQKFYWFRPKYEIEGPDWVISGSIFLHDYEIMQNGTPIATISKDVMTWGNSYELDIADPKDEVMALAAMLVIDCVVAQND